MLVEQDIQRILQRVIEEVKNRKGAEFQPHGTYQVVKEHADEVSVHSDGDFPAHLISSKYPSEHDEEFKYRKQNYQAITMPFWGRALNNVQGRVWNSANYSIEFENDELDDYLMREYPKFTSLEKYFGQVVTTTKIDFPNSVLAVRPYNIPLTLDEEDNIIVDQAVKVSPICVIYHSDNVYDYEDDKYFLLLMNKKSIVEVGSQKKREGLIFELYDDTNIWRVVQYGKQEDWTFEIEVWYSHMLDRVPCYFLQGVPCAMNDDIYYKSYFSKSLPFLNKVVCQNSTLDATTDKNAYATRVYYESECDNPKCGYQCDIGHVRVDDETTELCPSCRGTGKRNMFSPLRDYTVDPTIRSNEDTLPFPPLAYVAPGTDILEWLDRKIRRDIEDAFAFINMEVASRPNGQTATEVIINREDLYSFLLHFAKEIFMLMAHAIEDIAQMRGEDGEVTLRPPVDFTIREASDLANELKELADAPVPTIAKKRVLDEWFARRFPQGKTDKRATEIVYALDAFVHDSVSDIALRIGRGTAHKWQQVLTDNIWRYLDEIKRENEQLYLEGSIEEIKEQLVAKAQADTPADAGSADSILNGL